MFTGIIEKIGIIRNVKKGSNSSRLTVEVDDILKDTKIGDSISTNGVCLTVNDLCPRSFTADVMAETLRKSNLGDLNPGDKVNLERALEVGGRLGGHVVTGHIDGIGKIVNITREDISVWITIIPEGNLIEYIVKKGSIAIDGISLTVASVEENIFKVSIIPHTSKETTLLTKKIGDEVNLECDILGKYIEKFLGLKTDHNNEVKKEIDYEFLQKNGFM